MTVKLQFKMKVSVYSVPVILRLVIGCIYFACTMKILPFQIDHKTLEIRHCGRSGTWAWYLTLAAISFHISILNYKFGELILSQAGAQVIYFHALAVIIHCGIPILVEFVVITHRHALLDVLIQGRNFVFQIKERYMRRGQDWEFDRTTTILIKVFVVSVIITPINVQMMNWAAPRTTFFLSGMFEEPTLPVLFGCNLFTFWTDLVLAACVGIMPLVMAAVGIYSSILNEAKPGPGKKFQNRLREPERAFHVYRCLRLLVRRINNLIGDVMLILVNATMIVSVICFGMVARLRHLMPGVISFALLACWVLAISVLFAMYVKLGEVFSTSKKFVNAWKRHEGKMRVTDRKYLMKTLGAIGLMKIKIGSFGFYQKPAALRMLGRLSYYTNKALLALKV